MGTVYSIFQGVLGAGILFFFGILLFDFGPRVLIDIAFFVTIGAVIYGALWFVHRLVVGKPAKKATSPAVRAQRSLSFKVGAVFLLFSTIVAVGVKT